MVGTQVTDLALPLTAVLLLNATASELGLIRFLEQVPFVFCTLLFGAWVDRHRRKGAIIVANVARGVLIGLVPLLALLGVLKLAFLAAIACGVGVFTVLFTVSWLSYVPTLVAPEKLVAANGKLTASAAAAQVTGPGLGGVLIQALSAPLALLMDAASYAVATITLLMIRTPEPAPKSLGERAHLLRDVVQGVRMVWGNAYLRAVMLMSGLWNLLYGVASTTFLLYAVRERGVAAGTLGTIFAAGAVGGLVGAAISTRLGQRGTFGPVLGIAFIFGCVPWILLPAAAAAPEVEIVGYTMAFFLIQVGLGLWAVLVRSLLQAMTPLRLMGRVVATVNLVSTGLGALGPLLAGPSATLVGLRLTLWLCAGGFLINVTITLVATPLPRVRSLSTAPLAAQVE